MANNDKTIVPFVYDYALRYFKYIDMKIRIKNICFNNIKFSLSSDMTILSISSFVLSTIIARATPALSWNSLCTWIISSTAAVLSSTQWVVDPHDPVFFARPSSVQSGITPTIDTTPYLWPNSHRPALDCPGQALISRNDWEFYQGQARPTTPVMAMVLIRRHQCRFPSVLGRI